MHCDLTGPILCIPTVVLQWGFQLGDAAGAEEVISGLGLNYKAVRDILVFILEKKKLKEGLQLVS